MLALRVKETKLSIQTILATDARAQICRRLLAMTILSLAVVGCDEPEQAMPVATPVAETTVATPPPVLPPAVLQTPVDLVVQFPGAKLSSDEEVKSTPAGRGVFLLDGWDTSTGLRSTLIVLTGFSVTYPPVHVLPTSVLTFDAGMAYPSPTQARFWVGVSKDGNVQRIWEEDFVAPKGKAELRPIKVALSQLADTDVQLVIGVETPKGDSSAHWGVFADPKVE